MKTPRLNISWLMALVAIVALDFGLTRILAASRSPFHDLVIVGIVPLVNILALSGPFHN